MRTTLRLGVAIAVLALSTMFGATVAQAAPPTNDNFADAVTLTDGVEATGTNDEATVENPSEQNSYPSWGLNHSVWMTYTPAVDGVVEIDVCSEFRTNLIAFVGSGYGSLTPAQTVAPSSYAQGLTAGSCTGGTYPTSIGPFYVTGGVPLRIHLGSAYGGETGDYGLTATLTPSPDNDDFSARETLLNGVPTSGNNDFATIEPSEPNGGLGWALYHSDWYTFTPPADGVVEVTTCADFPTNTIIFVGNTLATLTRASTTPSSSAQGTTGSGCTGGTYPSFIGPFEVTGGVPLQIHLGSAFQNDTGDFEITADYIPYPANDDFADATELTSGVPSNGDSTNATLEPSEESYAVALHNTVWYSFDPATAGELEMQVCSEFPSHVTAWTGSSVDNLTLLKATSPVSQATSTTASCASGTRSLAYMPPIYVTPGTEIFFQVTGQFSSDEGELTASATLHTTPANDAFSGALDLGTGFNVELQDDNFATAANEVNEPQILGASRPGSTWYRWQAQASGNVVIDTCASPSANASIGVFEAGTETPTLAQLVAVADGSATGGCTSGSGAEVVIDAESGKFYWIAVANDGGTDWHGRFTLKIGVRPVAVTQPTLVADDYFVGTELSLDNSGWTGATPITYEYYWFRCDENQTNCTGISGSNSSTYTLAAADIGSTLRARVTATNAFGSTTEFSDLTPVIDEDSDGDGYGDAADACPSNANESPKTNGCPVEDVVITGPPTISGTAQVGSVLTLSLGSAVNSPGIDPGVAAPTSGTIYWYSCSSAADLINCLVRPESSATYTPVVADIGRYIRAEVEWDNSDGDADSTPSVATALVVAAPVTPPTSGGTPPPAAPVDPLTLSVKKSLGTVKRDKKGVFTFKGAVVSCGATATGPCTGTFAISAKVGKKTIKYGVGKTGQASGKSAAVTFKPSAKLAKAIKKAKGKKLKVTLVFSVSAPGFPAQKATATATLK